MNRELMEMQYRLHQDEQDAGPAPSLSGRFHILLAVLMAGIAAVLYFR